jgi:hypothetical protein
MSTGRRPEPSRITVALDTAGLFGAEADRTLGVIEPTVDLWEQGVIVPTDDQIADLAARAGVTVEWFYGPPIRPIVVRVCYRKKVNGVRSEVVTYPPRYEQPEGTLF